MDALVMCGGQGTRLDSEEEKPLYRINGRPMIDAVVTALAGSQVDEIYPVVSPHVPNTIDHLDRPVIETPGTGYTKDLQQALLDERVTTPVLSVAADLPLLEPAVIDWVLGAYESGSTTVVVPASIKRTLGLSIERTQTHDGHLVTPTGVNIVEMTGGSETVITSFDVRLAVNVNQRSDAAIAEEFL